MATQPKQTSRNTSLLMIGVLLLLLGLVGTYLFVMPELKTQRVALEDAKATLRGAQADVDALNTAKRQLTLAKEKMTAEHGVDFAKVEKVYPVTEDVPGLYLQLEGLMTAAGSVGVGGAAYQVGVPVVDLTENAVRIPVAIAGSGTYAASKALLGLLETNLRPFSVASVNLAQSVDKDKAATGVFTITISAVVRAETLSSAYTAK